MRQRITSDFVEKAPVKIVEEARLTLANEEKTARDLERRIAGLSEAKQAFLRYAR